jgi:hypothetical protein
LSTELIRIFDEIPVHVIENILSRLLIQNQNIEHHVAVVNDYHVAKIVNQNFNKLPQGLRNDV